MQWRSAHATHVGLVRTTNEDATLDRPDLGVWAVADGMGGHSAGDVASRLLVESLARLRPQRDLSTLVEFAEHAILDVNDRLLELARERGQLVGSTIVALLANRRHCAFLWAGDSRLYRLRDGALEQLTADHSQVERYVQLGLLSREEVRLHPDANLITRAVGAAAPLYLDCDMAELHAGDRYLLSSDGLDKHVGADELAGCLRSGDPRSAADRLVALALERGGSDNISVCVIDFADP